MKILLIGGGSGGHIIPLRAVAHEIKDLNPEARLIAVCETGNKFLHVYKDSKDIDYVYQIHAGKYRRYSGESKLQRLLDFETNLRNFTDIFRTIRGYTQARRMLRREKPDALLIKGGFVAVPVGLAAAHLGIPFITHDSDSTPGLANRIIAKWAHKHATGLPTNLYTYDQEKVVYTGIPVSAAFTSVSVKQQSALRHQLGIDHAKTTITIIGGSQGGQQLNDDVISMARSLMDELDDVAIVHIAGAQHEADVRAGYKQVLSKEQLRRVIIRGFVDNPADYTGVADIVITRASATAIAELSLQSKAIIVVPGQLADSHQHKNATYLESHNAAIQVASHDVGALKTALMNLLADSEKQKQLAMALHTLAKPHAARELAQITLSLAKHGNDT